MADTHMMTVAVPQALYERLRNRAEQTQRSIEDELVMALAETIGIEASLPSDLDATLSLLPTFSDEVLWAVVRGRVPAAEAERLADLSIDRQQRRLSDDEQREAETLVFRHDSLAAIRGTAAAILKERGHDLRPLLAGA